MMVFVVPSRLAAQQLAKSAGAVFLYSIDFDAGRLGAAHAFELPLLFGVHTKNRVLKELSGAWREPQAAEALSRSMMACFSFFRAGGGADAPRCRRRRGSGLAKGRQRRCAYVAATVAGIQARF
mmetsp:Transcript_110376/g.351878  ORF Transcript_110376/g.351878 Transcript_110376/m.351878 type:complete len:124 (+) Transcript_110376:1267-1638(+)